MKFRDLLGSQLESWEPASNAHPRGVRLWTISALTIGRVCFNTRTRAGCDSIGVFIYAHWVIVSIHAPARGATVRHDQSARPREVSIHAPARGATLAPALEGLAVVSEGFNTRTRAGCDITIPTNRHLKRSFNTRTRAGCDAPRPAKNTSRPWFQYTHPRGVRPPIILTPDSIG